VTLIDSNVFMYAAGREHPFKRRAARFLEKVAQGAVDAVIDAEVLQEILHRYRALARWPEGRMVYDTARLIFPATLPITTEVMDCARRLLDEHSRLMARDALHAAGLRLTNWIRFAALTGISTACRGCVESSRR
jgi:predicted nucleic acid-binding protein